LGLNLKHTPTRDAGDLVIEDSTIASRSEIQGESDTSDLEGEIVQTIGIVTKAGHCNLSRSLLLLRLM
jgi:hypothetical protein